MEVLEPAVPFSCGEGEMLGVNVPAVRCADIATLRCQIAGARRRLFR